MNHIELLEKKKQELSNMGTCCSNNEQIIKQIYNDLKTSYPTLYMWKEDNIHKLSIISKSDIRFLINQKVNALQQIRHITEVLEELK